MTKHTYKSDMGAVAPLRDVLKKDDPFHGAEVPDLWKIPSPARWNIVIRQLGIKEKIGSLYMPDSVKDAQSYTHGMGVVIKVGPTVFKGKKYEDLGLSPDDGPKPGDIVCFRAHSAPTRFRVDGIELMVIPDDAYYATVSPEQTDFISFKL